MSRKTQKRQQRKNKTSKRQQKRRGGAWWNPFESKTATAVPAPVQSSEEEVVKMPEQEVVLENKLETEGASEPEKIAVPPAPVQDETETVKLDDVKVDVPNPEVPAPQPEGTRKKFLGIFGGKKQKRMQNKRSSKKQSKAR